MYNMFDIYYASGLVDRMEGQRHICITYNFQNICRRLCNYVYIPMDDAKHHIVYVSREKTMSKDNYVFGKYLAAQKTFISGG